MNNFRPTPIRSTLAGLLILCLSACAVGPDFRTPAPPKVNGYTQKALESSTGSPGKVGADVQTFRLAQDIPGQWWKLFHSKPLNSLIEQALKANPNLQVAEASLLQALENVSAGEGSYFPSVSGSLSTIQQYFNGAAFGAPQLSSLFVLNTGNVSVSYPLDLFGGIRRQVESLKAQADYERFQLEAAYLTLTSNIVLTAIQEASLRAQIQATMKIIDVLQNGLTIVKRQFDLGAVSRASVLTQLTALAQEKATLPPLEKQLALERHQMAVYLGRFPSEKLGDNFNLETLTLPKNLPVSLPSRLVEQRPDIRSAEAQLHSQSALVGVATANMLPQISLTGQYGSESTAGYFTPGSQFWSYGPSLTQPIFQGGTLLHKKRAAVAAFRKAKAQYKNAVLQAFQNVADTLRALESDAETLAAQSAAEQAAAESLKIAERQFNFGAISYPALFNAQQAYEQSVISLVQARAIRYSDTVALFQALGGGWWNLAKATPKGVGLMKEASK
ncbi:MAG: efflux transporter outer membrane subunit [Leptospirales bacterium]